MARPSNEELRKKTIDELTQYAIYHPYEASRVAKIYRNEYLSCAKVSFSYNVSSLFPKGPNHITIDLD